MNEENRIEIETRVRFSDSDSEGAVLVIIEPALWKMIQDGDDYQHSLDYTLDQLKDEIEEIIKTRFEERENLQREIEDIIYKSGWVQGKPNTTVQGMVEQIRSLLISPADGSNDN